MSTESRLKSLNAKIAVKRQRLSQHGEQLKAAKAGIRAVKKELAELEAELAQLRLQQLSDTLTAKGITPADIQDAIAAGIFDKNDRATYSTTEQEVEKREASGS